MTNPQQSVKPWRTAIVLLNWKGASDSVVCLQSLKGLVDQDFCVVLVDNDSGDDSVPRILAEMRAQEPDGVRVVEAGEDLAAVGPALPRFTLRRSPDNGGFAAGNNQGIALALGAGVEYVWVLNNDVEVHPDALGALIRRDKRGKYSVVGSTLVYHDSKTVIQCIGGVQFDVARGAGEQVGQGRAWHEGVALDEPAQLSYVAGASMLFRADVLRACQGFTEHYFLYFEEFDIALKTSRFGPIAVATDSVVFHKEGASIGTNSRARRSLLSQYYLARNLILFYRAHFRRLVIKAYLKNLRQMVLQTLRGEWALVKTTFRATVDGWAGREGKMP